LGAPSVGLLGGDIVSGIQSLVDGLFQGFTGLTTTGNSFASVFNAASNNTSTLTAANTNAQNAADYVAIMAINAPGHHAVDPSLNASFPLTALTGTTPSEISVTQANSVIGMIQIPAAATKSTIVWQGFGVTSLSAAYVNLYSVNIATGALTKVYSSANIISDIGSGLGWIYVPMTTSLPVVQNSWYAAELQVVGTGTHTMVGLPSHWIPANPNVFPSQLGATRAGLQTVAYDAVGAGATANSGSVSSLSWSHTVGASATAVVVLVASYELGTISATFGGTTMTNLGSQSANNAGNTAGAVVMFGLLNPPTGAQTVNVSFGGTLPIVAAGNSTSYTGVGAFSSVATGSGSTSTAMSQSVSSGTGQMALTAFAVMNGGSGGAGTIASFNQTQRYNASPADGSVAGVALAFGDAAGAATVSFTAADSAAHFSANIGVSLQQAVAPPPSTIPSPTYSANVPWLALSSETAGTSPSFAPQTTTYAQGAYTYTLPPWAAHIDLVGIGGGGAGQGEQGWNLGQGGHAGTWNAVTLTVGNTGTQIPIGNTIAVTVGAGAPANNSYFLDGATGGTTTFVWTDASSTVHTLTCAGGVGGGGSGTAYSGFGAGNETWNGVVYYGGGAAASGTGGNGPGGGGGGAPPFLFGAGGGAGGGWVRALQT
jgi:hypothetical protein